jgi:hypothetical protein
MLNGNFGISLVLEVLDILRVEEAQMEERDSLWEHLLQGEAGQREASVLELPPGGALPV